jgi:hypothetical protein
LYGALLKSLDFTGFRERHYLKNDALGGVWCSVINVIKKSSSVIFGAHNVKE